MKETPEAGAMSVERAFQILDGSDLALECAGLRKDNILRTELRQAKATLQSRLAEAEADARRYRWLRNRANDGHFRTACGFTMNCDEPESEWDAQIDAALAAAPTPPTAIDKAQA